MTPDKAQLAGELHDGGFPPEAIAVLLGASIDDVRDALGRRDARTDTGRESPVRQHKGNE